MNSTEYRQALQQLGLSQRAAAKYLGITERHSRRFADEELPVSLPVIMLLRLMLDGSDREAIRAIAEQEKNAWATLFRLTQAYPFNRAYLLDLMADAKTALRAQAPAPE